MPWNPVIYESFKEERTAPFDDLLALVERREGLCVIDLGCGTGELTRRVADALPASDVVGIDNSAEMLAKSTAYARAGLRFALQQIEAAAGEWDVVFSNAALQWVDNHATLFPRLFAMVNPGGQLVIQMPRNHEHYSHRAIKQVAGEAPFVEALKGWTRTIPVLPADEYAEMLYGLGAAKIVAFEKIYPHVLCDSDAVAKWISGTALVPYMERLPESLREPFMVRLRGLFRERWPESPVFYGFRRVLLAATR